MQQSQAVVGLLLWGTTITLLLWPYVSWRFDPTTTLAGIPLTYFGLAVNFRWRNVWCIIGWFSL